MSWRERLGRNWGRLGMRSEWITSTIDDICKLVTDGAHNSPKSVDNGYYMASVKDFTAYGFDFSNCRKISEADYLKLKKQGCVPESGDILVGKDGARYFEDVIIYRQKEQPALLSSIAILRVDDTKVTSEFLYYTLKSPAVKKDVRDNYGSGSAIPRIVLKDFKRMPISFPSLKEQKKITNICELLDEKIQLNNRINNNLEQQAQAIYQQMFIENQNPNWKEGKLSDLVAVKYGKDHKKLDGGCYPVYGSGGIMRYVEKPLYTGESVLIPRKGTLNNVMYVNGAFWSVDTMFYTEMLRPNIAKFVYHFVKGKDLASLNAGSAVPSMTTNILNAMPLCVPDDKTLSSFEETVTPMYSQMQENEKQSANLANIRDTLLPRLMSGELEVSDIDL